MGLGVASDGLAPTPPMGWNSCEEEERLAVQPAGDRVAREDPDVGHTSSVALLRSFRHALASPSINPLAKVAKDVSAAAVLIAAIASVAIGWLIFWPRLFGA